LKNLFERLKAEAPMSSEPDVCPFCSPSVDDKLFADDVSSAAIVNKSPIVPGHSLIVPKRHVVRVQGLTDKEFVSLFTLGRDVAKLLATVFGVSDFNWTIQDGESAGQTVDHVHLHLIPRYEGDLPEPGDWYPRLEKVQESVRRAGPDSARVSLEESEQRLVAEQLRKAGLHHG
jgi:bis(5'-adenosyl)-triphosphatase